MILRGRKRNPLRAQGYFSLLLLIGSFSPLVVFGQEAPATPPISEYDAILEATKSANDLNVRDESKLFPKPSVSPTSMAAPVLTPTPTPTPTLTSEKAPEESPPSSVARKDPQQPKKGSPAYFLNRGNYFYGLGDCSKSIRYYERILSKPGSVDQETHEEALFRGGYCYAKLDRNVEAENCFKKFLGFQPDNEEAQMKHIEALFALGRYTDVVAEGNLISSPNYLASARLIMAQSYLALEKEELAIKALADIPKSREWDPIVSYWRGVAYFNSFEESKAVRSFLKSRTESNPFLWTRSASENWLKSIKESRRFLRAQFEMGYHYDNNISSSATKDSGSTTPNGPASYVKDQIFTFSTRVETRPFGSKRIFLVPSLYLSLSSYHVQKTYNSENINPQLTATQVISSRFSLRESISYLDSRYQYHYYQDYLSFTPAVFFSLSQNFSFNLSYALSRQLHTQPGGSKSLSAGMVASFGRFYVTTSFSSTSATGEKATAATDGTSYSVTSGVLGSNYKSTSQSLGMGSRLFWGLDAGIQYTLSKTNYAVEILDSAAASSLAARQDADHTWQFSLARTLIERRLTLTFLYSKTSHKSTGFQGLLYSTGGSPDYNYSRNQAHLLLGLNF